MLGFHSISEFPISDVKFTEFETSRDSKLNTWMLTSSTDSWILVADESNKPPTRWTRAESSTDWTPRESSTEWTTRRSKTSWTA